jgi:peptidoglycan/xylan/chitin deacetylase (PgdA/CDA1 family)
MQRELSQVLNKCLTLLLHGVGRPGRITTETERLYWMPSDRFDEYIKVAADVAREASLDVLFTFDDGNHSDFELVAPVLLRLGLRAIFFPTVDHLGRPDYLSASDVRSLHKNGFEIGSHGRAHVDWTKLEDAALHQETFGAKDALQNILGVEVRSVAIPFGAYNRAVLKKLHAAGFASVYSSDSGLSAPSDWFKRRWGYRADTPISAKQMVAQSNSINHAIMTGVKHVVKSLR